MYQDFFSLKELPFSISPDPDFLFLSERHKEALAHLKYGLQSNGGFVLLTGEVGTGKTTLCRVLQQEMSVDTDVAFILNPAQTEVELLASICDQFKIPYYVERASLKTLFDAISRWMILNLEKGRNAIVLIDEAQHLSFEVLEQLRLLTNIESENQRPLQVILIGQTELQQKLKENQLRQLAQRITARYHLLPLDLQESSFYIIHRLNIAGARAPIFNNRLLKYIYRYTRGIPRLINLVCDRSMLCAYSQSTTRITAKMVDTAVKELDLQLQEQPSSYSFSHWWRFALLIVVFAVTAWQAPKLWQYLQGQNQADKAFEQQDSSLAMPHEQLLVPEEQTSLSEQAVVDVNEIVNEPQLNWFDDYPELDLHKREFAYALQTLYAIWGYAVNLSNATCENGASVSLQCFSDSTNVEKLKRLNYPAVVKLVRDEDAVYAVLYKVREQYELLIGTQKIEVSEEWFREYWNGGVTLLWRAPFEMNKPIVFGQKGQKVAWLNAQMNALFDLPAQSKTEFDNELKDKVMEFQGDNHLEMDGIVGKRTLLPLVQQLEPNTPSLL